MLTAQLSNFLTANCWNLSGSWSLIWNAACQLVHLWEELAEPLWELAEHSCPTQPHNNKNKHNNSSSSLAISWSAGFSNWKTAIPIANTFFAKHLHVANHWQSHNWELNATWGQIINKLSWWVEQQHLSWCTANASLARDESSKCINSSTNHVPWACHLHCCHCHGNTV